MTVQPQNAYQYYAGPISAGTTLAIQEFAFASDSHVSAKIRGAKTTWLYGTDYEISGANDTERTITVLKDVAENEVLAVYLEVPITQSVSPEEGGKFPAATQEFVLDKLTYICQMLQERLKRAFQVSVDTDFDGTVYDPTSKAGKAIKINATGTGLDYSTEDIDTLGATIREIFTQVESLHDETELWKNLAKDWAIKTSGEVEAGQGYGAKKYAEDAATVVTGFDTHAAEVQAAYNTNAAAKLVDYNANDIAKTGLYNANAVDKTNAFNINVAEKTNEYNTNAAAKLAETNLSAANAAASASAAALSEANATASEAMAETHSDHANIWAEGTDTQVQMLGGEHSAREWARQSSQSTPDATETVSGKIRIATQDEADIGSNDTAAMTPLKVASQAGRLSQIGFDGTLANKVLTFTHSTEYTLLPNTEYEVDLLFAAAGELDDDVSIVIMNGDTEIKLVSSLDRDITTPMTVASMRQVMRYNIDTGFRWLFKAAYKVASDNSKVLLLYPVVANVGKLYVKNLGPSTETIIDFAMPGLKSTDKVFIMLNPTITYAEQKKNQKEFAKIYNAVVNTDKLVLATSKPITKAISVQLLIIGG